MCIFEECKKIYDDKCETSILVNTKILINSKNKEY